MDKKSLKKKIDFCIFGYSPIHIYSFASILNEKFTKEEESYNAILFVTKNLYEDTLIFKKIIIKFFNSKNKKINIKIKLFYSPGTGKSIFEKFFAYIKNFLNFKCENVGKCFLPNSANPYIALCLYRLSYDSLINIDEGYSYASLRRFFDLGHTSSMYKLLKLIPNINMSKCLLDLDSDEKGYFFEANKINKLLENNNLSKRVFDLNTPLKCFLDKIQPFIAEEYKYEFMHDNFQKKSLFIVTSPLTANRYTEYFEQEIDIIESFIGKYLKKNPEVQLILKPHYREKLNKYKKLKLNYSSLRCIAPENPFQVLAMLYKDIDIVCFHSSAVFSVHFLNSINKIYCLSPQIKTKSMQLISSSLKNFVSKKIIFINGSNYKI